MSAEPQVVLLAYTRFNPSVLRGAYDDRLPEDFAEDAGPDELHEFAGRCCYLSFDRPNPATFLTEDYLQKSIINNDHTSVLEHASFTFYVTGVSRSLLLELERHRHLSFSVVSQRYVDPRKDGMSYVVPPAADADTILSMEKGWEAAIERYDDTFIALRDEGKSLKEAREAARAHLPNSAETRFVVTGNIRAWRHIIAMRTADGADKEICRFAEMIERELKWVAPYSMQARTDS